MRGEGIVLLTCCVAPAVLRVHHELQGIRVGHIIEVPSHDRREGSFFGCFVQELLDLKFANFFEAHLGLEMRSVDLEICSSDLVL